MAKAVTSSKRAAKAPPAKKAPATVAGVVGMVTPPVGPTVPAVVAGQEPATQQELVDLSRAARDAGSANSAETPPDFPIRLTYPVLSPLRHSARRYAPGDPETDTIELTEAEAETLLAIGVLGDPS